MRYSKGNYKIKMPVNLDDQTLVLRALRSQGCWWRSNPYSGNLKYLYTENGILLLGGDDHFFNSDPSIEIKWQDIVKPKEVDYEIF